MGEKIKINKEAENTEERTMKKETELYTVVFKITAVYKKKKGSKAQNLYNISL